MAAEALFSVSGNVATITLNRPKRGNSLTPGMSQIIIQSLKTVESDPTIGVVVLTGNGKYFCTGMDLGPDAQAKINDGIKNGDDSMFELWESFRNCTKPIIAKVNGPVMGGGIGLLFLTDIRIVSSKAYLWFAEVKRGIAPALISAYIVPQIGQFLALNWMMTGKRIPVKRAYDLGIISEVVEPEQLNEATDKMIKELLGNGPQAMKWVKELVKHEVSNGHESNKKKAQEIFGKMMKSPEAMHGISSFIQRKKPDWSSFRSKL
mmetsp:Transcript_9471/g.10457  ORF Transcript_9471/g.10457 Transcript_9471/m.10457 type:complete len:263 (+) Transcript_9471:18-806(+)